MIKSLYIPVQNFYENPRKNFFFYSSVHLDANLHDYRLLFGVVGGTVKQLFKNQKSHKIHDK